MSAPTRTPEETSRLLREAVQMAKGESLMLPTREHLAVLADGQLQLKSFVTVLTQAIVAIMLDTGQHRLTIPERILAGIAQRRLDVGVEPTDGYLTLVLKKPAGDTVPDPIPDGPSTATH